MSSDSASGAGRAARARLTRPPHPENVPGEPELFADLVFDPSTAWFSDAPLVRVNEQGECVVVRGELTDRERAEIARQRPSGSAGETLGVLTNSLGAVTLARVGEVFFNDPRDVHPLAREGLLWGEGIEEVMAGLQSAMALLEYARDAGFDVVYSSNTEQGLVLTDAPERVSESGGYRPPWPDFARGADPALHGGGLQSHELWAPAPRATAAEAEQGVARALAQAQLREEFGLAGVDELTASGLDVAAWLAARAIFTVPGPRGPQVPGFALDGTGQPRPLLADVLTAVDSCAEPIDGWALAVWFTSANVHLDGTRPVDVLTSPEASDADRNLLAHAAQSGLR